MIEILRPDLCVIGAGRAGSAVVKAAAAQALHQPGSEMAVLATGRALFRYDPELATIAMSSVHREGVTIREDGEAVSVESSTKGVTPRLTTEGIEEVVEAPHFLLTETRRPQMEGRGLDAAGIDFGRNGLAIGPKFRTSDPRVFRLSRWLG